jgi:hypothetical protein
MSQINQAAKTLSYLRQTDSQQIRNDFHIIHLCDSALPQFETRRVTLGRATGAAKIDVSLSGKTLRNVSDWAATEIPSTTPSPHEGEGIIPVDTIGLCCPRDNRRWTTQRWLRNRRETVNSVVGSRNGHGAQK